MARAPHSQLLILGVQDVITTWEDVAMNFSQHESDYSLDCIGFREESNSCSGGDGEARAGAEFSNAMIESRPLAPVLSVAQERYRWRQRREW